MIQGLGFRGFNLGSGKFMPQGKRINV